MKAYRKITILCFQLLLVLGLLFGTQTTVKADQLDEGKAAFDAGKYLKVLEKRIFRQMKSGKYPGQPLNQFHRAYRAHKYQKAFERIKPIAEQGHLQAQVYLGAMYNNGQGVAKDHTEAAKWYRKAAMVGWLIAQNLLGTMYAIGHGVPQDNREAAKWYRKAAEQGHPDAQLLLGKMYAQGQGVSKD